MTTTQKTSPIQNGFWTIIDSKKNEHRTFRIWTEEWDDKVNGGKKKVRVVGLLTGPNNETDYTNFATVSKEGDKIWVWSRFKRQSKNEKQTKYETYGWIIEDLRAKEGKRWGYRFSIEGHGRCCVCNRRLTNPESIETGIGPVCAGK